MTTNAPKRPLNEGVNRVRQDGVNTTTAGVNSTKGVNPVNVNPGVRPVPPPPPPPPKKP